MSEKIKIVYLHISSWRGISIGAQHYYGKLQCTRFISKEVELKRVLSKIDANKLNKDRGVLSRNIYQYKDGDEFIGFDSTKQVRNFALSNWKKYFSDGLVLIEGRSAVLSPQKILISHSSELLQHGNNIYNEFASIDGYQGDEKRAEQLTNDWKELFKLYDLDLFTD